MSLDARQPAAAPLTTPDLPRISDYLEHWARVRGAADAVIFEDQTLSYAELATLVQRCATRLRELGVARGSRVAMLSTPRPEFFIVFLATVRLGGVWLGLNPRYTLEELRYVVADAEPCVLISIDAFAGRDYGALAETLFQEQASIRELRIFRSDRPAAQSLDTLLAAAAQDSAAAEAHEGESDDPALLVYTSGTTGQPKGALLPHRGLVYCSRVQYEQIGVDPLRVLNNLPINHVGCVGDLSAFALVGGGTIVFAEKFTPEQIGPLIERHQITFWGQVPTMFQLTLDNPAFDPAMARSLQIIAWSGAMAPAALIERLRAICPRLHSFYGMTETVGSVTYSDPGATVADLARTIGRPDPHYELRIAALDGSPVPAGEAGEIQVRGDFLMRGYLNRPEATAQAYTADGWLKTGDLAVEEPDGQYRLIGRAREMFKSGGYNVYPREIEAVLEGCPAVAAAAVVATPDPLYQEVGTAFVVQDPAGTYSEADMRQYCRTRLANYKIPKHFHWLADMPMLPIGKIDRAELKRRAATLAGA